MKNIIKYSDELIYAVLDLDGTEVFAKANEELEIGQEVYMKLDPNLLGVKDINFNVVII